MAGSIDGRLARLERQRRGPGRQDLEAELTAWLDGLSDQDLAALAGGGALQLDQDLVETGRRYLAMLPPDELAGPAERLPDVALAALALASGDQSELKVSALVGSGNPATRRDKAAIRHD